jgi:hypothetical protein
MLIISVLALLVLVAPSARAAEMGLTSEITWGISRPQIDQQITLLRDLHTTWIRADAAWNALEPTSKGVYNLSYLSDVDYAVSQARAAGIQVEMVIHGTPYWASADPAKFKDASGYHYNSAYRPVNFQDYADFAGWAANHFKAMGVHVYEVWSEQNLIYSWPSGPDPATYVQMLKAAYPAIHQADPAATVLMGGLFTSDYDFLQAMYDLGAKPYFDAANVHPYSGALGPTGCYRQHGSTRKPKEAFCGIEEIHNTMVANGDGAKQLWLTEWGYSTESSGDGMGVTYAQQAQYLTQAYAKAQSYPYVKALFWYQLHDSLGTFGTNLWNGQLGLMTAGGDPKWSYFAFREWAVATQGGTRPFPIYPPPRHRRPHRRRHRPAKHH